MRVSRQIGWSDKSNVLYDILQELEAISCKIACSTTSSSTTTPPTACNTYVLINGNAVSSYSYVNCNGDTISGDLIEGESLIICARSVSFSQQIFNIGGDPCSSTCTLYQLQSGPSGGLYSYTSCEGFPMEPTTLFPNENRYICALTDTVDVFGTDVTVEALNLCKCIEYTLEESSGDGPGACTYIGCDLIKYNNVPIPTSGTITICSYTVPDVSPTVNIFANSICNP